MFYGECYSRGESRAQMPVVLVACTSICQLVLRPGLSIFLPDGQIRISIGLGVSKINRVGVSCCAFRHGKRKEGRKADSLRLDVSTRWVVDRITTNVHGIPRLVNADVIHAHRSGEYKVFKVDPAESVRNTKVCDDILQKQKQKQKRREKPELDQNQSRLCKTLELIEYRYLDSSTYHWLLGYWTTPSLHCCIGANSALIHGPRAFIVVDPGYICTVKPAANQDVL